MRRKPADKELITVEGKEVSVAEYFKAQYGVELEVPGLPCLWVGSRDRSTFIPAEFCRMLSQPLPRYLLMLQVTSSQEEEVAG